VTGGSGFLGTALVPLLLREGHRVRVLDLMLYGSDTLQRWRDHPHLQIVKGDVRRVDVLLEALAGMDSIVHLAAIVGEVACDLDPDCSVAVNLAATQRLAEAAKGLGIQRLIFASTCSVYGGSEKPMDEDSDPSPLHLYARTKLAAERGLLRMNHGMRPTVLRFATGYGMSDRPRFDLAVNAMAARALREDTVQMRGGAQWRPFIHVDDAARAIVATLRAPLELVGGRTFNVGDDAQNRTIRDVAEIVQHEVAGAKIVFNGELDPRDYQVSFARFADTVGFEARLDLRDGVAEVVAALSGSGGPDWNDPIHHNARFLEEANGLDALRHGVDWAADWLTPDEAAA
jgi:nucleoside-diphosphate-sugar epimerase